MHGMGTVINTAAIVAGGILGRLFGRFLSESTQEALTKVCGVSTLFIAVAGALEGMLSIEGGSIVSGGSLLIIGCLALGTLVGELLKIEDAFERFGPSKKPVPAPPSEPAEIQAPKEPAPRSLPRGLSPQEQAIYNALEPKDVHINTVAARTGLDTSAIMASLTLLELKGHVAVRPGGWAKTI